jgi:hypothetical protein
MASSGLRSVLVRSTKMPSNLFSSSTLSGSIAKCWVPGPVKAVSRRRRGPQASLYRPCHPPHSTAEVDGWQQLSQVSQNRAAVQLLRSTACSRCSVIRSTPKVREANLPPSTCSRPGRSSTRVSSHPYLPNGRRAGHSAGEIKSHQARRVSSISPRTCWIMSSIGSKQSSKRWELVSIAGCSGLLVTFWRGLLASALRG